MNRFFLEWGAVPNDREEEMADSIRVNWACDVLRRPHEKPFFLAVGLYAPHFPNYAPQKYFDLYDSDKIVPPAYKADDLDDLPPKIRQAKINRSKIHQRLVELDAVEDAIHGYLACVSYADAMLGRVLKALEESPYKDNTVVVLWSDHGYHHGEKGHWGKHTLWERTSNVPFIWAGPRIAAGTTVDTTVSLIDMYPTFVEMCALSEVSGLEGTSLAPVLNSPQSATDRNVYLPFMDPGDTPLSIRIGDTFTTVTTPKSCTRSARIPMNGTIWRKTKTSLQSKASSVRLLLTCLLRQVPHGNVAN